MTKKVCIFGSLFQEARSQTALSQWEISVRAGTNLSNVNQVEAGNQEPNVILAVKMLLAVNADIQSFFMELASLLSLCIECAFRNVDLLQIFPKIIFLPYQSMIIEVSRRWKKERNCLVLSTL